MRHAFLITAYTDATQLRDLVERLDSADSIFYIHIDAKSPLQGAAWLATLRNHTRVRILEKPMRVYWGGFSHFKGIFMLMKRAVHENRADYLHLLSGQCYPIQSLSEFDTWFEQHKGKEFMTAAPIEQLNWTGGSMNRLQLYHLNDLFNIRVKFWKRINSRLLQWQRTLGVRRKLPLPYSQYYGGGTWWSLSAAACSHMVELVEKDPGLLSKLKHTHCAEEIVFQTLLGNSPFKDRIVQNDLRYVDWNARDGNCPVVLDERDLDAIRHSGKLIARKFVSGKSDALKSRLGQ